MLSPLPAPAARLGLDVTRHAQLPGPLDDGEEIVRQFPLPFEKRQRQDKLLRWAPYGQLKPVPGVDTAQDFAPFEADPEPDRPPQTAATTSKAAEAQAEARPVRKKKQAEQLPKPRAMRRVVYDFEHSEDENKDLESVRRRLFAPEAAQDRPRRLGRSVYDAMQTHGHFGLVDGGETLAGGVRRIVVHVPKRNRGYALDLKPGEVIYANSARGRPVRGRLDVVFVSRHKYVPPGHAVTSCVIGVSEGQWARFLE
jgi:hypothetical protein